MPRSSPTTSHRSSPSQPTYLLDGVLYCIRHITHDSCPWEGATYPVHLHPIFACVTPTCFLYAPNPLIGPSRELKQRTHFSSLGLLRWAGGRQGGRQACLFVFGGACVAPCCCKRRRRGLLKRTLQYLRLGLSVHEKRYLSR
jgi:hypothetical protein